MNMAKQGRSYVFIAAALFVFCAGLQGVVSAADDDNSGQPGKQTTESVVEKPEELYVLKRLDLDKIGAEASYETFSGVRVPPKILKSPSIGIGQRVEIFQEPKPVDAYIIMAKEMMQVETDNRWNNRPVDFTPVLFRTVVQPLFVRAYGTEVTVSDPKEGKKGPSIGQVRYTLDYRDVYKEFDPKFPGIRESSWLQNEVMLIHSTKIEPINWMYTSNVGFRFSNVDDKDTGNNFDSGNEMRETYIFNISLKPNPRFESFTQFEFFKSRHIRCAWSYQPDHWFYAEELRFKSKDMKTSYIGRFSYSTDIYLPFNNTYEKYEAIGRVGRDFTPRFSGYTALKYAYGHTCLDDNDVSIPVWPTPNPCDVSAAALTWESKAQYNVYDRLWIQGGFELGTGLNMSDFDNVGCLFGLEYYAPGIIRIDVGWRGNLYYNIDDTLGTVYFKVYFFM